MRARPVASTSSAPPSLGQQSYVASLVERYWAARQGTRDARHKWILRRFVEFTGRNGKHPEEWTVRDFESFGIDLRQRGYRPDYISRNFAFLRRFLDHLELQGIVSANRAREAFARAERSEPRVYTDEELLLIHRKYHPRVASQNERG